MLLFDGQRTVFLDASVGGVSLGTAPGEDRLIVRLPAPAVDGLQLRAKRGAGAVTAWLPLGMGPVK